MNFSSQGYSIAYQEHGPAGKIPVVFIHGFPFSQDIWRPQVDALKGVYRLVTYDNRGHGQTSVGDGQYLIEFFVDDLIALLDHLKISKAILCGLSMGGYIALRTVERNPDRVHALVLCDTRSEADPNEGKLKRAATIKVVKEKGVPVFVEGFLPLIFTKGNIADRISAIETIRQLMLNNSVLGICGTLLALAGRTDTTAALANIKVPTLIMVGDQDPITPIAASQAMHKAVVGSELQVIPNASHLSNLENAAVFNQHLLAFLRKVA
jgi:3-oxoadipate enol-lactonase